MLYGVDKAVEGICGVKGGELNGDYQRYVLFSGEGEVEGHFSS